MSKNFDTELAAAHTILRIAKHVLHGLHVWSQEHRGEDDQGMPCAPAAQNCVKWSLGGAIHVGYVRACESFDEFEADNAHSLVLEIVRTQIVVERPDFEHKLGKLTRYNDSVLTEFVDILNMFDHVEKKLAALVPKRMLFDHTTEKV